MLQRAAARFELQAVGDRVWHILDRARTLKDSRRIVGTVYELEADMVEVAWQRDIPAAVYFTSPADALDEVQRVYSANCRTA